MAPSLVARRFHAHSTRAAGRPSGPPTLASALASVNEQEFAGSRRRSVWTCRGNITIIGPARGGSGDAREADRHARAKGGPRMQTRTLRSKLTLALLVGTLICVAAA